MKKEIELNAKVSQEILDMLIEIVKSGSVDAGATSHINFDKVISINFYL